MAAIASGALPKDYSLIVNLPGINGTKGKIFWNDFVNTYRNDSRLDVYDVYFLDELVKYFASPQNWGQNWNKARAYSYFSKGARKLSKYRIDKIYEHLVSAGYLECRRIDPHKITELDNEELAKITGQHHTQFYWVYQFNFQPQLNKPMVEETEISNDNIKETVDTIVKESTDRKDNKEDNKEDKEEDTRRVFNTNEEVNTYIEEQYKSATFENIMDRFDVCSDEEKPINEYIVKYIRKHYPNKTINEMTVENVYDLCWRVIARAISYNDKALDTLVSGPKGKTMAEINRGAMETCFLQFSMYQMITSNVSYIKNNTDKAQLYRKKLLLYSSIIIHNYIKLGFLGSNRLPKYKELLGLYKTINDNLTLIYKLYYSKESYQELHTLYIANQERFNLRT